MKKLTKKNICMSSWCQVVAICICIFASQVIHLGTDAQNTNEQITPAAEEMIVARQTRALNSSGECPLCNLSEMPMEMAEKINEISDVSEFINDFVDGSNSLLNVSSLDFHPANRRKRAAAGQIRQATCTPIDTLVTTVPNDERDPTVFYFPSCILVKQCGGCCAHSGTTCTPTDEVERTVTIKKTKYVNGETKLQNLGDVTMTVKEHNKCKCLCKKTAADCNGRQKFIKSQCRCECTNSEEAGQCAQNPKKLFDSNSCACVCRDTRDCAAGFQFDQETCTCQPILYNEDEEEFPLFGDHNNSETYEATDEVKYDTLETVEASTEH